jgi:imidazole glycerol phosphate synthase subunit HisF
MNFLGQESLHVRVAPCLEVDHGVVVHGSVVSVMGDGLEAEQHPAIYF